MPWDAARGPIPSFCGDLRFQPRAIPAAGKAGLKGKDRTRRNRRQAGPYGRKAKKNHAAPPYDTVRRSQA